MPAAQDLMDHPRTFLRANVLMVIGASGGVGGLEDFEIAPSAHNTARNMLVDGNPAMPVYTLRPYAGNGDLVRAYWCPFLPGNYLGTTLPGVGGPNIMFTFAMDGCTFVAGSRTDDHSVQVHHVNMAGSSGLGAEASEQQYRLQRYVARSMVTGGQLVDPDDYYNPATRRVPIPLGAKISTVTFGRRSSRDGWKFYTHQWYTVAGARMQLCFIGTQRVI